jgi:hypothetical protein
LFRLLAFADDEKGQYLANISSTDACVSSAGIWANKREEISEILNEFYTRRELVVCALSYATIEVLTIIQNLLNVPDTQTRERDHQEAQFHDDKTLLEEMRTKIKAILSEDPNEYVSMCHELLVIDRVHRFPTYVHDIETPFDELQDEVIDGSPRAPAVSPHPHKSIIVLTSGTVARGPHDSDKYADRGCSGDSEGGDH